MLREIEGVTAVPPTQRRWFHDDYFDLFVWQTLGGEVIRFQLCYGIHSSERALVWERQSGFFHDGLVSDPEPLANVIARFDTAAPTLPKLVRQTVGARLYEFAKPATEVPARRREFRRANWQKRIAPGARRAG